MTPVSGRILIADDEPALLRMLGIYLARLGHTVTSAGTAESAWQEVERAPAEFAVAVLDASLAGIGLDELALRILAANPRMRVLTASGYPVDMTVLEAAAPGRVAFLLKPFSPQMLAETVGRMIGAQEESV